MGITTTKQQRDIEEIEKLTDGKNHVYYIGSYNCYSIVTSNKYFYTSELQKKYNIDRIDICDNNKIEVFISKKQ